MSTLTTVPVEATLPPEVARFCAENQALAVLRASERLAREIFHPIRDLQVGLESDPETGEEYLVIDVVVGGSLDSVLEQYQDFTDRRVAQFPADDPHRVRLMFDVCDEAAHP